MFLTWHLAGHLQMSKQSPCAIPRIVKAIQQALLLYSVFIGAQIVWYCSDRIKVRDMHSDIKLIPPSAFFLFYFLQTFKRHSACTYTKQCALSGALLQQSEAASISVTQHAEVTLGANCSLLQVLLAKVHTHRFISTHQFVRATHFCLLAQYFKSKRLFFKVSCGCQPAPCVCKHVSGVMRLLESMRGNRNQQSVYLRLLYFTAAAWYVYFCPPVILPVSVCPFPAAPAADNVCACVQTV